MLRVGLSLARRTQPAFSAESKRFASSSSRSLRRDVYITLGLLAATAGTYYYQQSAAAPSSTVTDGITTTRTGKSFKITIPSSKGNREYPFERKPDEETEGMLHEHEDGDRISRPGNPVVRWDRNWVGSNEPCEDRSAVDIIPRTRGVKESASWWKFWQSSPSSSSAGEQARKDGDRDLAMFSIFDGHGGDATSKLLAKSMHPTLTLSLAALQAGHHPLFGSSWKSFMDNFSPTTWDPANVISTLKNAFVTMDNNICQTPIQLLPSALKLHNGEKNPALDSFVALSAPAVSGACAISAIVDAEHEDLYVASTGDCRAVAGWQDTNGNWRCDALSEDQMGENLREVERMQREHPTEKDTVIMRGRVQGGLQPTRAIGDASYKWTAQQISAMNQVLQAQGAKTRKQPPYYFSPPYVTAEPEVAHRKLSNDKVRLRFIVMATDGLWDRITSEESTLLVASYLAHRTHPDIPKTELATQFPLTPNAERPYPVQDLPGSPSRSEGSWVFEGDKNAATHLIRNSLAGGDRIRRGELLSTHGDVSRYLRDDITVNVIFFDEGMDARSLAG